MLDKLPATLLEAVHYFSDLEEMMDTAILTDKDGNMVWVGKHVVLDPTAFEDL